MDTRNVIAAISLSAAVIILYSLYFAPPPITKEQLAEKNKRGYEDAPVLVIKKRVCEKGPLFSQQWSDSHGMSIRFN